ncbi:HAMP domain-containing sensor histidine kinase [Bradyrhizobium sp.]|uniref:sensor histidine kinase n=1 Tax=Bradyrhizobium sp. TaxID=376 RepID=UPI001E0F8DA7|nr:HAMP domain-containing sensor histidine kinase [Bradyrhizobium sp.]MBI5319481.1 HAMP domain-containing histidine kinase [Bradyrhizobium sp.]
MLRRNFRTRLIVGAALWIVVGQCITGLILASMMRGVVISQLDHDLRDHTDEIAGLVDIDEQRAPVVLREISDARFRPARSGFYWQVQQQSGATLRSASLQESLFLPDGPSSAVSQPAIVEGPTGSMRLMTKLVHLHQLNEPVEVRVGADERLIDEEMARFHLSLTASLGIIGLGLFAAAYIQIAYGLQPLTRIRHAVAAVRSGRTQQLPVDLPAEVMPLVMELNAVISANQSMVERARVLAGNFAHALKMPLAILTEEARELRRRGHAGTADVLFEQCSRLTLLIDYQTARARASAVANTGASSDPAKIIRDVIGACARLHGNGTKRFTFDGPSDLVVACDPNDLTEMIGNLVDNAGKWSRAHVAVTLIDFGDVVQIAVEDDGPGIPAEHREAVFGVGMRVDEDKPGTGLGLAIAYDLATLYGGRLWIETSHLGGAAVNVTLTKIADIC